MPLADQLRPFLEGAPEILLAVLFGSHARGTAGPDSDIDLALRIGQIEQADLNHLLAQLERATGRTIDVVHVDSAPPLLRFEIARDGVLLVQRTQNAWPDFRARAMLDWWEWDGFGARFAGAAVSRLRAEVGRGPA